MEYNTQTVRGFESVSLEGLYKLNSMIKMFKEKGFNKHNVYVNSEYKEPKRKTRSSAGSDIYYTGEIPIILMPNDKVVVITNVKAYMQPDEVLYANVRSSQGLFHNLMLCNTVGVIDSDYYNNEGNEGNIAIALRNIGDEPVIIRKGEAIAQLVFSKYLAPDNLPEDVDRVGGFNSTGK